MQLALKNMQTFHFVLAAHAILSVFFHFLWLYSLPLVVHCHSFCTIFEPPLEIHHQRIVFGSQLGPQSHLSLYYLAIFLGLDHLDTFLGLDHLEAFLDLGHLDAFLGLGHLDAFMLIVLYIQVAQSFDQELMIKFGSIYQDQCHFFFSPTISHF